MTVMHLDHIHSLFLPPNPPGPPQKLNIIDPFLKLLEKQVLTKSSAICLNLANSSIVIILVSLFLFVLFHPSIWLPLFSFCCIQHIPCEFVIKCYHITNTVL